MHTLVQHYKSEGDDMGARIRKSHAIKKARDRAERLELLLARAYYALNDAHVMAYNPTLLMDIRAILMGKNVRPGPKIVVGR